MLLALFFSTVSSTTMFAQGSFVSSFLSALKTGIQMGLSQDNTNVSSQSQGLLIDKTGFAPGYKAPDMYDLNINKTGRITRTTNWGSRIDYTDGYFRGLAENGRRSAGTVYFYDGRRETCTQYDSNGKFNGTAIQEWPDGSWAIGNWSHGSKNGNFSKAIADNGTLTYYDEVWSDGSCLSSTEVNSPSQSLSAWDDHPFDYDVSTTQSDNSSSSSSSSSSRISKSSCWRCKGSGQCTLCGGSGYIRAGLHMYGANDAHKCSNCNGYGKCQVCYGRGR